MNTSNNWQKAKYDHGWILVPNISICI